jgi:iron complex outermembrane receptor protein
MLRSSIQNVALAALTVVVIANPSLGADSSTEVIEPASDSSSAAPTSAEAPEEPRGVVEESLEVVGDRLPIAGVEILTRETLPAMPAGDGAALLRDVAGISIGRMGGHGLEPRIRGLGEGNLNIVIDGAFVHGGCPNRMDPPSSFASTGGLDRVVVLKGVQSLRYGAGGSAGTVLFEREAPVALDDRAWSVNAETGYRSWSERPELQLNTSWVGSSLYLRADAESRSMNSYEDGSGDEVRSAFDSSGGNLMIGIGGNERGLFEVGYEHSRTDDALFAGAGMDSPEDRGNTYRLKFRRDASAGGWSGFEADLYASLVNHLMDNYSLRDRTAPAALRVPSTSDTFGGRARGDLALGERLLLTLGLDYQNNQREALRFAGPTEDRVTMLQSVMWPDAELAQAGIFLEGERSLAGGSRLRFGGRIDSFEASAGKADLQPAGMNLGPNQLYQLYYGLNAEDWNETGVSALVRYERPLKSGWTLFSGLSRSLRAPDATERYLGASNPVAPKRWVGRPDLDVAKNHQIDLGVVATAERGDGSVTAFIDEVDDFISRDRARGQEGVLLTDRASIYRNVDARLRGLELEGRYRLAADLTLTANASYVRGDNRTDSRPLAQIPPLQGLARLDYTRERWRGGAAVRWADDQTRVDDNPVTGSGVDYGPTAGYGVLDLEGSFAWKRGLELLVGLENVFDKTYADHLNRGNVFDPDPVRINEPGRAGWVRVRWSSGQGY